MADKVDEILGATADALQFWNLKLESAAEFKNAVPPALVTQPLAELVKLASLIRAHSTKVGIIYEPSKLRTQTDAASSTVSEFSKSMVAYISVLSQLDPAQVSNLFYGEILSKSRHLVGASVSFFEELKKLKATADLEGLASSEESEPATDHRLLSVGKLWNVCDDIASLINLGNLKFLQQKTKVQLSLIEDGLDEFEEWAENPEEMDDEDPFGLESLDDDEPPSSEPEVLSPADLENLSKFSKHLLQKFKLVKLLLLSINKSLPSITAGSDIDEVYRSQSAIVRESDSLIVELMMNCKVSAAVYDHSNAMDRACFRIASVLRKSNKGADSKIKWLGSWELKFHEITKEQYGA